MAGNKRAHKKEAKSIKRSENSPQGNQELAENFDSGKPVFYFWSIKKNEFLADNAIRDYLGIRDKEKLSLELFISRVHPEEKSQFDEILELSNEIITSKKFQIQHRLSAAESESYEWFEFMGKVLSSPEEAILVGSIAKVTEAKSNLNLNKNIAFRNRVFEGSPIPIVIMDAASAKFIDCNQAAVSIYGMDSREAVLGMTPIDVSAPVQYDATSSEIKSKFYINKAKRDGLVIFDWKHQRPNGEFWDAEVHLMSFSLNGRQLLQFTLLDVSSRKQVIETLKEKTAFLEATLNATYDGILIIDENQRRRVSNKRTSELFEVPKHILADEDDAAHLNHAVSMTKYPDKFVDRVKYLYDHPEETSMDIVELKTGTILQRYSAPIWDDNKYFGRLWSFTDITENRKAEQALKESENMFRSLMHATPYPLSVQDLKGRFQIVNQAFCDTHKLSIDKIIGKSVNEIGLKINPNTRKIITDEMHKTGQVNSMEVPVNGPEGIMYFLFSSRLINIEDKPLHLTITLDITEKKKIELEIEKHRNHLETLVQERTEELAATNEELLATNEELYDQRAILQEALKKLQEAQQQIIQSEKMASLGLLSAGVAHEINNPLNFIQGGVIGIENYLEELKPAQADDIQPLLNAIYTGVERAAKIVSSLNHYSRQDDHANHDCDIHTIIDDSLIMLWHQFKDNIEVQKYYAKEMPHIFGNEGKLHQLFLNIISNAGQAIEDEGTITIRTCMDKQNLHIEISDTGRGIEPEISKKIFDPFFTTKVQGKGTGLGLSIAYNIIQEHKGSIELKSELGKGTTALIQLPLKNESL